MIPSTKAELLAAMEAEHGLLLQAIAAVPTGRREAAGMGHPWSVKDVLAHLVAWKRMFLGWYAAGRRGENPRTPAEDLNWRQTPELNQRIYEEWRGRSWMFVEKEFAASWAEMLALARVLPEEELFQQGLYPWMRKWPLGRWIAANTSSHYRWARGRVAKMRFSSLPEGMGAPANRALAGAGVTELEELGAWREEDVARLHGIGPKALRILKAEMEVKGVSFAR